MSRKMSIICRLCFKDNETAIYIPDDQNNLAETIKTQTTIEICVNDLFPKHVCCQCIDQIIKWIAFKKRCLETKNKLTTLFSEVPSSSITKKSGDCVENTKINKLEHNYNKKTNPIMEVEALEKKSLVITSAEINSEKKLQQIEEEEIQVIEVSDENDDDDVNKPLQNGEKNIRLIDQEIDDFKQEKQVTSEHAEQNPDNFDDVIFDYDEKNDAEGDDDDAGAIITSVFVKTEMPKITKTHKKQYVNCPKCGLQVTVRTLPHHLMKHTERFKCIECNLCFLSNFALKEHQKTIHNKQRDYVCDQCGASFGVKIRLKNHILTHSELRLFECNTCLYTTRTYSCLYRHKIRCNSVESIVCEQCGKKFKSKLNYSDHKRRAHSRIKKHQCKECDKSFVEGFMLKKHLVSHTKTKEYPCEFCGKAYSREDTLMSHLKTHSANPISCKVCRKRFLAKETFETHKCNIVKKEIE